MEPDRYQQNSKLFVIGLICLLTSLSLFAFGFYVMPYLLWNWGYNVPGFISTWREWFKESYDFTDSEASWLIFFIFIIPAVICGYISQRASNYIDNQIYDIHPEKSMAVKRDIQETLSFSFKIFLLIILVFVAVTVVEWLVAPPID